MPATNYNWPFADKPEVYPVFGTKRKNTEEECGQDAVEEMKTKRRCTDSRQCKDMDTTDDMEVTGHAESQTLQVHMSHTAYAQPVYKNCTEPLSHESHHHRHHHHDTIAMHSNTGIQDLAQHHLQVTLNNRVPPLPDATGDNMENNNNIHPVQDLNFLKPLLADSQNDMIMDLNEGVYSTAMLPLNPQTDAEYEAACSMMQAMEGEGGPNPQQYTVSYCDSHCVGGHTSPNSGKVRCLCNPSWEGLREPRQYISDYY